MKKLPKKTPRASSGASRAIHSKSRAKPVVGIIMGSTSDWDTMRHAADILDDFHIGFEASVVSAHRTPKRLYDYATTASSRGLKIIIAGAGGAAHLPGMAASLTALPVLGVPVETKSLGGHDSLLSIVQMPAGIPVGTLAIGVAGAKNAALLAVGILALSDAALDKKLRRYRDLQTQGVPRNPSAKITKPKLPKSRPRMARIKAGL